MYVPGKGSTLAQTIPLTETAASGISYYGIPLSLYPGGSSIPAGHLTTLQAAAAAIQPLDTNGDADANGKIGFAVWGMSNPYLIAGDRDGLNDSWRMIPKLNVHSTIASYVIPVNLAESGADVSEWESNDTNRYDGWAGYATDAGLDSLNQVQFAIIYHGEQKAVGTETLPGNDASYYTMLASLGNAIRYAVANYLPNLQLALMVSRPTLKWSTKVGQYQPNDFEQGLSVKTLIAAQVNGVTHTSAGAVAYSAGTFPAIWWTSSSYLYTVDGNTREDGWQVTPDYFASDGAHPSQGNGGGIDTVSDRLIAIIDANDNSLFDWFHDYSALFIETGDYLLLETGDKLLLE